MDEAKDTGRDINTVIKTRIEHYEVQNSPDSKDRIKFLKQWENWEFKIEEKELQFNEINDIFE